MTAIHIRPAVLDDRPFIVSGWSTSMRASEGIPLVSMDEYAGIFRPIIERHVACSRVLVAHGETGVLFGFIVYDPTTYVEGTGERARTLSGYVLYVYVADPFRRLGIASRLFERAGIDYKKRFGFACRTYWSWNLRSKTPLAKYDPYRARYGESYVKRSAAAAETEPEPHLREQTVAP